MPPRPLLFRQLEQRLTVEVVGDHRLLRHLEAVVQGLCRNVVDRGHPFNGAEAPVAGDPGEAPDDRRPDTALAHRFGDEDVLHEQPSGHVARRETGAEQGEACRCAARAHDEGFGRSLLREQPVVEAVADGRGVDRLVALVEPFHLDRDRDQMGEVIRAGQGHRDIGVRSRRDWRHRAVPQGISA